MLISGWLNGFVATAIGGATLAGSVYSANQARKGAKAQVETRRPRIGFRKRIRRQTTCFAKADLGKAANRPAAILTTRPSGYWQVRLINGFKQKMTPQEKGNAITSVLTGGGNPSRIESNNVIKNYNSLDNPLDDPFKDYLAKTGLAGGQFNQKQSTISISVKKQGQNQLDRNNASSGMGYSGSQLKTTQQFGQGLASQQYDKEYSQTSDEFSNYYNRFAALAQGGQQAVQATGNQGAQYAQNAGNTLASLSNAQTNILGQQANARASGYAASANAFNQILGNMIDIYGINRKYG